MKPRRRQSATSLSIKLLLCLAMPVCPLGFQKLEKACIEARRGENEQVETPFWVARQGVGDVQAS